MSRSAIFASIFGIFLFLFFLFIGHLSLEGTFLLLLERTTLRVNNKGLVVRYALARFQYYNIGIIANSSSSSEESLVRAVLAVLLNVLLSQC